MNSMQLKAKLRNVAKEKNMNFNSLLRLYMYDRFLERLSKSKYRDNFVLKVGFYLSTLFGVENRATMDIDTAFRNDNFDEEVRNKLFSDASIISLELYNQTILNNSSYINMDNNDWIKDNNEYKVMTMNNEFTSVDSAKTYIILKLNGNVTVSGGNGTQLKPYILN